MEFLLSVLTVLFIALLLATAVTFGFVLLVWFVAVAMAVAVGLLVREMWHRWRFLQAAKRPPPGVIEAEYEDISPKE